MDPRKNVTLKTMVLLNLINFGLVGFFAFDGATTLIFLQTRFGIENDIGSLIVDIGKLMVALSFFFGVFSDKTVSRMGKRRPIMLIGGLISAPCIALIPHITQLWMLIPVLSLAYFGVQFAAVPYFSLVPEVVPNEKLGTANAFFSAFGGIGTLLAYGVLFPIVYVANKFYAFYIIAAVHLFFTCVTVFSIKEFVPDTLPQKENRLKAMAVSFIEIIKDMPNFKDLTFFLAGNLFFWLGLGVFVTFFTKFMKFYANVTEFLGGLMLGGVVIVSILLAVPIGTLGDKISRRMMVFVGMLMMSGGLIAGYFVIGPNSKVSGLNLYDYKTVVSLAQKQNIDMTGADLSLFTDNGFTPPLDINKDEMPDKKVDVMRWCLIKEFDGPECDKAVAMVMGKNNPKLKSTSEALKTISVFVTGETSKVIKAGIPIIAFAAIGMTLCVVIMATILPTLMPENKMGLYMGFYSTVTGLGQFLSVTIGGIVIQKTLEAGSTALGYRWMFMQGAVSLFIAAFIILKVPYIPNAKDPTITDLSKQKK